jgi:hypothetical protein
VEGCIEWTHSLNNKGYGVVWREGVRWLAHRLVYADVYGPIPEGLQVRHRCDNPPCVNLEHLVVGTQSDNMSDSVERGRHANAIKTHCPKNHDYDEANTYIDSKGRRFCRACNREAARTYREKVL